MVVENPHTLSRDELVQELAEEAVEVARGAALDARAQGLDEAQTASDRLPSQVELLIDGIFRHPEISEDDYGIGSIKADVLDAARAEME